MAIKSMAQLSWDCWYDKTPKESADYTSIITSLRRLPGCGEAVQHSLTMKISQGEYDLRKKC